MKKSVEKYFAEIGAVRATQAHVAETSFYTALANLLNDIGHELDPKVRCVLQLQNRGAGMPDGGLFTADQLKRRGGAGPAADPFDGQLPARGVIEAKAPDADIDAVAAGAQVEKYWQLYGLVLVTNFREFLPVGRSAEGKPVRLESFSLATSDKEFWALAAHPHKAAERFGALLPEYLLRVMLHNAPLTAPQDVAALLASYARDAKIRIEHADLPALAGLRQALEETLGLRFEGPKGEHFFRSTLVQTLFYGVFSAWVLWARQRAAPAATGKSFSKAVHESAPAYGVDSSRFDWRLAQWLLRVPMIRALFNQVADPDRLGKLGLVEVLNWTANALNRVDGAAFFVAFDEGHAVQYFYEPFLEAFDPELRKELGVWYTPEEIVCYQVERVDAVLRQELDLPDGLADPRVVVLDPCCGTGAYLRAVLARIAVTLREKGGDALVPCDLKQAAMSRVFGFEILPAPFVIAHLQIGLLLENLGAPLDAAGNERAGVYLTNALTGWEPPKEPKKLLFPEMQEERDAAERVKREARVLVVIGNPPYNGFAGIALDEERELSNAYRTVKKVADPQGQGLNDLFVRFFRMAERRIVEKTGQGIVCFISNYSWLEGLSYTGMRERYLDVFDRIAIDCLNGDKYKTGKLTPDGQPDPSVFSTEFNREGIQVGTAISLLVKRPPDAPADAGPHVLFRHFWGKTKRADLLTATDATYQPLEPALELGLPLLPATSQAAYFAWPQLRDLFPTSFPGVKTSRDDFLVDTDRDRLEARLQAYFDPKVSHEEMRRIAPGVMDRTARFDPERTRDILRKRGFRPEQIVRYAYRPFDVRWLYWEPETKLLDEKRTDYVPHVFDGNAWISAGQRNRKDDFYQPQFTGVLADHHLVESNVGMFPLWLHDPLRKAPSPNLSPLGEKYVADIGATHEDLFYHVLAVLHAPAYRTENAGALRQDWPRIPLPQDKAQLLESAALGRQVAALLDSETPVPGVTAGKLPEALKAVAVFARVDGKPANPADGDFDLTAGWGHAGKGGVTMPGKGKVRVSCVECRGEDGSTATPAVSSPPPDTRPPSLDIYLNDIACWRNVPKPVWEYTIGGYQVVKKWLSYREKPLLGRSLTIEEVRYVTDMTRRIAALLTLHSALDESYRSVTGAR